MMTFAIKTLGCKVNQYDSEAIREKMLSAGYQELTEKKRKGKKHISIINTCTVTKKSDQKSLQMIRKSVKECPDSWVIVTGCLADSNYQDLKNLDGVDLVLLNNEKEAISHKIKEKIGSDFSIEADQLFDHKPNLISNFQERTRAFVKIQDGCESFCSYCKIPYVRGKEVSRNFGEVLDEVDLLAKSGYKEIVLTGIHLGRFNRDKSKKKSLANLLLKLEKIEDLFRIRLSSIEIREITDELILTLSQSKKICPNFHIPLQSGSNRILERMNRNYTRDEFLMIIDKIKKKISNVTFTTDVIVGFSGEEDEDVNDTIDVIKKVGFHRVHVFPFSKREGTKAYLYQDSVPKAVIQNRVSNVSKQAQNVARSHYLNLEGKMKEVLVENETKEGCIQGYTKNYEKIICNGDNLKGNDIVSVKIINGKLGYGIGEVVS